MFLTSGSFIIQPSKSEGWANPLLLVTSTQTSISKNRTENWSVFQLFSFWFPDGISDQARQRFPSLSWCYSQSKYQIAYSGRSVRSHLYWYYVTDQPSQLHPLGQSPDFTTRLRTRIWFRTLSRFWIMTLTLTRLCTLAHFHTQTRLRSRTKRSIYIAGQFCLIVLFPFCYFLLLSQEELSYVTY
jgi:hypothetical protein